MSSKREQSFGGGSWETSQAARDLEASIMSAETAGISGQKVRSFLRRSPEDRARFIKGLTERGEEDRVAEDTIEETLLPSIAAKFDKVQAESLKLGKSLTVEQLIDYFIKER